MLPPYLQQGSVIGITCPSSYVAADKVAAAVGVLEGWGFRVRLGNTIDTQYGYFSGADEVRRADLQAMLDDEGIDAILMGRGGYGMSRIIDELDFTAFNRRPKWICGFSDITVLHSHLQARHDAACLHSPMCGSFTAQTAGLGYMQSFYAAITGQALRYTTPPSAFNRNGAALAPLTGGNLSLLAHLTGSASEVNTDGKILFIEDIGEYLYNADRLLLNLKRAGKLDRLKGLIIGGFTDMQDTERPFGQSIEDIIAEKAGEYDYPVCFHFPAGHQDVNYTLTLGAMHRLVVTDNGGVLELVK